MDCCNIGLNEIYIYFISDVEFLNILLMLPKVFEMKSKNKREKRSSDKGQKAEADKSHKKGEKEETEKSHIMVHFLKVSAM